MDHVIPCAAVQIVLARAAVQRVIARPAKEPVLVLAPLGFRNHHVIAASAVELCAGIFRADHAVATVAARHMDADPFGGLECDRTVGVGDDALHLGGAIAGFGTGLISGDDRGDAHGFDIGRHPQDIVIRPRHIPQGVVAAVLILLDVFRRRAVSPIMVITLAPRHDDTAVHGHHRIDPIGGVFEPAQVQPKVQCPARQFLAQRVQRAGFDKVRRLARIVHYVVNMLFAIGIAEIAVLAQTLDRGAHGQGAKDAANRGFALVIVAECGVDQWQQALPRHPIRAIGQTGEVHDGLGDIVQGHRRDDLRAALHLRVPQAERHMGGAVPLAHLMETVVVTQIEPVVRQQDHRRVLADGGLVQRVQKPPDLMIHMRAGREIAAHHLSPRLIPRLFRRPLAVDDIGKLIDRHARLRAGEILGRCDFGPRDLIGVVHLIEPVGTDQIVMRMFEAQLDQMAPVGRKCFQVVNRVLRHPVVVELIVLLTLIVGVVDALDPRSLVQIGFDAFAPALVRTFHIVVEQDAAVVLGHGFVIAVGLAGGKGLPSCAAQIVLPRGGRGQFIAPQPVQIDQTGAIGRQARGQLCAARRAQGYGRIGIGKAHAARHEPVDVRGLDRHAKRGAPREHVDHIVDPDDGDVVALNAGRIKSHGRSPVPETARARRVLRSDPTRKYRFRAKATDRQSPHGQGFS